jgi:hypothetical protein
MGCCHAHGYHHRYRCSECGEPLLPLGYAPQPVAYAPPPREDYVRTLEDERETLERRLRRLEREIEELRAGAQPTAGRSE